MGPSSIQVYRLLPIKNHDKGIWSCPPYFSFFQEWESDSGQKPQCDKPIKLSAFETFDIGYISNLFEILDNALCYT